MPYYFAQISISPSVERKIRTKHGISTKDLRMALIFGSQFRTKWDFNNPDGPSLVVVADLASGRKFMAHLLPVDESEGIWILKTAYHLHK
jgi:hypothetical protein